MHTIKGSGSMFGFDDIADFTHHVEDECELSIDIIDEEGDSETDAGDKRLCDWSVALILDVNRLA